MTCPICKKLLENLTDKNYKNTQHLRCKRHKIDLRAFKKESK